MTIDSEVDEILFMAFVGLWMRDEENNFVSLDDKYGALKDHLKQEITNLIAQEAKAFGGCRNCYGKGYATVISGTKGYADFGGDGFRTPPTTHIKYCSCDRGKQLKQVVAQEANKARIDPFDFVEPCEPDCSPERHAYHQGQWDMAGRINKHFGLPPHPTADREQDV